MQVSVDLTNTGKRPGVEIVQLYLRDEVASVGRYLRELKAFQRVELDPGQTKTVTFTLGPAELALLDRDFEPVVEPGWFTVYVGGSSDASLSTRFEVVGPHGSAASAAGDHPEITAEMDTEVPRPA